MAILPYYEDLMFENIALDEFKPDLIYIHNSIKNITYFPSIFETEDEVENTVDKEYNLLSSIVDRTISHYKCKVIVNNIEFPNTTPSAHWESIQPGGKIRYVNKLNEKISTLRRLSADVIINDLNHFANKVGLENYHSTRDFANTSYCMSNSYVSRYAYHLFTTLSSIMSLNKKIIVTDLDNTLWDGVIGDDGVDAVMPSADKPISKIYLEYQDYLKNLSEIGILLSVASKNEKAVAEAGLSDERMLVSLDHFVDIQANWQQKSKNIQSILRDVNLLPYSCVFVDDNPAERDEVKINCPEIIVPDFENAAYDFVKTLDSLRLFAPSQLTIEDRERSRLYKDNVRRFRVEHKFEDKNEYLASLQMQLTISQINDTNIVRCAQLLGKTNQFNFTNKKASVEQLREMIMSDDFIVRCASLADKFGSSGVITVIIFEREELKFKLWNWVMSCRVFERKIEGPLLKHMFDQLLVDGSDELANRFHKRM